MVRRLSVALLLGFLSACSLFVDLDGLSDASDPAGQGDGGPSPVLPNGEAGVDAATTNPSTGTSPCAAAHTFCDDFDTGDENLATRWSELTTTAGPLDLDTTRSRSAPRSLRMNLKPTTGNQDSHLAKSVPVQNGTARAEVDIFVPTPVGGSYKEVDPIGVELHPTPTGYDFHGLYLIVRPDGTSLQYFASKKSANVDHRASLTFTMDAWHHVVITVSYATTPPTGTISIDGAVASVPMMGPTATKLDLELGADYTDAANLAWSLSFDNAVVDSP